MNSVLTPSTPPTPSPLQHQQITNETIFDSLSNNIPAKTQQTIHNTITSYLPQPNPFSFPRQTPCSITSIPSVITTLSTRSSHQSNTSSSTMKNPIILKDKFVDNDLTPHTTSPPKYHEIYRNVFVSRKPKQIHRNEILECDCAPDCEEYCDETCINRTYHEECYEHVCKNGRNCRNRRFQNREWKKTIVKNAGKKGWGLYANEKIYSGEFVHEYVGEVIDEQEHQRRMHDEYVGRKKFYVLSTDKKEYIDATQKGNSARYMNHSCDPNLKTEKWTVLGERCIGFFAIRDIEAGEELTFDYQFERYGNEKQLCYCGSKNCRIYLGGKKVNCNKTIAEHKKQKKGSKPKDRIIYKKMDNRRQKAINFDRLKQTCCNLNHEVNESLMKILKRKNDFGLKLSLAKGRLLTRLKLLYQTNDEFINKLNDSNIDFDDYLTNDIEKSINKKDSLFLMSPDVNDPIPSPAALCAMDEFILNTLMNGKDLSIEQLHKKAKELNQIYQFESNGSKQFQFLYGVNNNAFGFDSNAFDSDSIKDMEVESTGKDHDDSLERYNLLKSEAKKQLLDRSSSTIIPNETQKNKKKKDIKKVKQKSNTDTEMEDDYDINKNKKKIDKPKSNDDDFNIALELHKSINQNIRPKRTRSSRSKNSPKQFPSDTTSTDHEMNTLESLPPIIKKEEPISVNAVFKLPPIQSQANENETQSFEDEMSKLLSDSESTLKHQIIDEKKDLESNADDDFELSSGYIDPQILMKPDSIPLCNLCGATRKRYKNSGVWRRHLTSKHTYECKHCELRFTTKENIDEHILLSHSVNNQSLNNNNNYTNKKKLHKIKKPHTKSSSVTSTISSVTNSSLTSTPTDSYPNENDSKSVSTVSTMNNNDYDTNNSNKSKSNTPVKRKLPNVCPHCKIDRNKKPKSHWIKHIDSNHQLECSQNGCLLKFAHPAKLKQHQIKAHQLDSDDDHIKKKQKRKRDSINDSRTSKKRKLNESKNCSLCIKQYETDKLNTLLFATDACLNVQSDDEFTTTIHEKYCINETELTKKWEMQETFENNEIDTREPIIQLFKKAYRFFGENNDKLYKDNDNRMNKKHDKNVSQNIPIKKKRIHMNHYDNNDHHYRPSKRQKIDNNKRSECVLFVDGLPMQASDHDIKKLFDGGIIKNIDIRIANGNKKKYALVTCFSERMCQVLIKKYHNKKITIGPKDTKEEEAILLVSFHDENRPRKTREYQHHPFFRADMKRRGFRKSNDYRYMNNRNHHIIQN